MSKIKHHLFSIGFFFLTIFIALYAMYFGDEILADGTVVETGRMMMSFMLLSFAGFIISLIVEFFLGRHRKSRNKIV